MPSLPKKIGGWILWLLVPFIGGCFLSQHVISDEVFRAWVVPVLDYYDNSVSSRSLVGAVAATEFDSSLPLSSKCEIRFRALLGLPKDLDAEDPFAGISLVMHRNGEPESCGEIQSSEANQNSFLDELRIQYAAQGCPIGMNKYQTEALLTSTFHSVVTTCPSKERFGNKKDGLLGFCDMGPKHTPILLDHDDLIPINDEKSKKTFLPCHFHTREGLRITDLRQLTELIQTPSTTTSRPKCEGDGSAQTCPATDDEDVDLVSATKMQRHLFAVPAGRIFMFAPSYVGEIFRLPHVEGSDNKPIYLEVLSLEPRVFDVFNFFSRAESAELVEKAIAEKKDSHRIKRSTTGASGKSLNSKRTSESGFDTHGKTAVTVKKRCFKALGFDEYLEGHGDGLQILRYNVTKAYNSHMDYFEDQTGQLEFDFDSAGTGGNRFATILMYMSDLGPEDGGETVFTKGWPSYLDPSERISSRDAIMDLRASDYGNVLEHGSWEEDLVAKCRTRLSIRPHSSRAVLFYSQHPNGAVDHSSLHGACPILSGQKYAANLWVWNTPRQGYPGAPIKEKFRKNKDSGSTSQAVSNIHATFKNSGRDPKMADAKLFYEDQFWGNLGTKNSHAVNTFEGHVWNVKVGDTVVKTWEIANSDGTNQEFVL